MIRSIVLYIQPGARWIVDIDIAERVILAATVSGDSESMSVSGDYIKYILYIVPSVIYARNRGQFVCATT
jgi:hypothetical protein